MVEGLCINPNSKFLFMSEKNATLIFFFGERIVYFLRPVGQLEDDQMVGSFPYQYRTK